MVPIAVRRNRLLVLGGVAFAIALGAVIVIASRSKASDVTSVPVDSPTVRVAKAATFAQAIEIARPSLGDTTDELGDGAQLLATYAAAKLRWAEVAGAAETTLERVAKQPALERGRRLCATGEILGITKRELGARSVHLGRLRTTDTHEIAFVAVGTTGDLAARSTATFCGAALGMSGSAVSILGMFDFEENRRPLVEQ